MCLRPALLPDEFALGYQGRVMRLNGWILAKDAMAHMAKWAVASSQAESSCAPVEYLAYVAGIPIADFVRHHTLFPYVRAFGVTPDPRWPLQIPPLMASQTPPCRTSGL